MRQILYIAFAAIAALAACTRDGAPAPDSDGDSYHRRAWEMRDTGAPAAEWLRDHPDHGDTEGVIQLFGNLGGLYAALGMGDEALEANTRAMQVSRRLGGRYMADLYRFRATVFDLLESPDSVIACLDSALAVVNSGNIEGDPDRMRLGIIGERADYILERVLWPDSVDALVARLESLRDNPYAEINGTDFTLGRGYLLQGRADEGIVMMERALDSYRRQGDVHGVAFALPPLMDAYARYGRTDRLAAEFPTYSALQDTLLNREKLNAIIGADLRSRASLLRAENEALRLRHRLAREHTVLWAAAAVIILLALAAFIYIYIYIYTAPLTPPRNGHAKTKDGSPAGRAHRSQQPAREPEHTP